MHIDSLLNYNENIAFNMIIFLVSHLYEYTKILYFHFNYNLHSKGKKNYQTLNRITEFGSFIFFSNYFIFFWIYFIYKGLITTVH